MATRQHLRPHTALFGMNGLLAASVASKSGGLNKCTSVFPERSPGASSCLMMQISTSDVVAKIPKCCYHCGVMIFAFVIVTSIISSIIITNTISIIIMIISTISNIVMVVIIRIILGILVIITIIITT